MRDSVYEVGIAFCRGEECGAAMRLGWEKCWNSVRIWRGGRRGLKIKGSYEKNRGLARFGRLVNKLGGNLSFKLSYRQYYCGSFRHIHYKINSLILFRVTV